jgi:2-dehydropantoate 2-reductase
MKIAIIGTGGVGGYFGAKLVRSGCDVCFLARGDHLSAMRKNGLTVKSIAGDFHVENVLATDRIRETGPADLVVLGVKAWQVREVRDGIKSILSSHASILPLQNGVLAADELMESIDPSFVLGGCCRIMSRIESPGVINHSGMTPTIIFGELGHSRSERIQRIKELFDKADIRSQISNDIHSELWKKFIAICVSGLLAVTRATYGELRERKETRQLMIGLLKEGYALSQRIGVDIEPDFIDKSVSFIDTFPYDSTSSLARDVWEGKPSEIEYQNGTVVRLGEKYGFDTPINRFVYYCILPMESRARKCGKS